jgi:D-xylose 1-dehydrogenase (NADP+, D-xylono-1,5-lactone-forming)
VAAPVRWGILSTANINRKVLPGMRASEEVQLVAVASRDGDRAAAYAREQGIPRAHTGYEALLADPDVEAVYISLPKAEHVPWSRRALEAGKHVLCEKPLTRRADEAAELFDLAERAGRLLVEAFMWRHHPQTRRLVELVRSGAIGDLRLLRAVFSFTARDPGNVRLQGDLEGGSLMDVGCYCVNGMRLLAGEPAAVTGQQVTGGNGVDVRFAGTLRWDGVLGTFDCGLDVPGRDELEAIGSEGTLFVDDPWHGQTTGIELRRSDGEVEAVAIEAADPYQAELEDLSRAIRGGGAPLLGRDDAVGQARVIEALYRAAAEGRDVAV